MYSCKKLWMHKQSCGLVYHIWLILWYGIQFLLFFCLGKYSTEYILWDLFLLCNALKNGTVILYLHSLFQKFIFLDFMPTYSKSVPHSVFKTMSYVVLWNSTCTNCTQHWQQNSERKYKDGSSSVIQSYNKAL